MTMMLSPVKGDMEGGAPASRGRRVNKSRGTFIWGLFARLFNSFCPDLGRSALTPAASTASCIKSSTFSSIIVLIKIYLKYHDYHCLNHCILATNRHKTVQNTEIKMPPMCLLSPTTSPTYFFLTVNLTQL
jgi:hypothetical protein